MFWRKFGRTQIVANCWKKAGLREFQPQGNLDLYYYTLLNLKCRRLELGTNCVSMVVDERSIVCGLEDGRVDVYSRATIQRYSF